jgi:thioredoxin reductase
MGTITIHFTHAIKQINNSTSVSYTSNDINNKNDVEAFCLKVMSTGFFYMIGSTPDHIFIPNKSIDCLTYKLVNGKVL